MSERFEREVLEGEYKPITAWGYFGYEILFAIPIVGLICALLMSIVAKNKNVKNFARSQFCFFLVILVAYFILAVLDIDITP